MDASFFIAFQLFLGIMNSRDNFFPIGQRFRGFLPVVVDVETGGFNHQTDALLQIAAITIANDEKGQLYTDEMVTHHIEPFPNANMEPESRKVNGIDPYHPLRLALPEQEALANVFKTIRKAVKQNQCSRAILVGHNAAFDLNFLNAAVDRCQIKRNPFHPFSMFDTVTLGGMAFGQTVLARAVDAAKLGWDEAEAHSAIYDAQKTADLFCHIINRWQEQSIMTPNQQQESLFKNA